MDGNCTCSVDKAQSTFTDDKEVSECLYVSAY